MVLIAIKAPSYTYVIKYILHQTSNRESMEQKDFTTHDKIYVRPPPKSTYAQQG